MTQIKTGGAAFPHVKHSNTDYGNGMTLRDYFAGHALAGIIHACALDTRERGESTEEMFSRKAYSIADAMLEARK